MLAADPFLHNSNEWIATMWFPRRFLEET